MSETRTTHEVSAADTAAAVGSGDVEVLGTPRLIAWMEAATVRAAADLLLPEQTSVGTSVRIQHVRPSAVGSMVEIIVDEPEQLTPRRLGFTVNAFDAAGEQIAHGEIERAVVDRAAFLASLD